MIHTDLLIHSAAQLITCASADGKPKRGAAMREVGLFADGAVAVLAGQIVAVGTNADLRSQFSATEEIDASGRVVCPGFVDPHTHLVYGGDRVAEFEMKLQGAAYLEILAAGGGIVSTMRATRAASFAELLVQARARLDAMLALGTTTLEAKSGYGLDTATELRMLQVVEALDRQHVCELVPTFLAAHAIPPEYKGCSDAYVDLVIEEMLPAAVEWHHNSHFATRNPPFFIDVFCEQNAFTVEQSRRVLTAGQRLGLAVKAHVDEFNALGGTTMALELGAISVDHLDVTSHDEIQRLAHSDTIGVILPAVNFNLGSHHFANARAMLDAGAALALSTDINPGSAPCPSQQLVMAIACRYQKLLPSEALNASTINAAHAIGLGQRVGSLEVGKQADILILEAPDYRHLAYQFGGNLVQMVVKKGRVVKR